jgi:hypothetical protein
MTAGRRYSFGRMIWATTLVEDKLHEQSKGPAVTDRSLRQGAQLAR